jgi:hypothetical protein
MRRSKVFLLFAAVFIILISFVIYDISRKTTFPGSKPQLQERLKKQFPLADTTAKKK